MTSSKANLFLDSAKGAGAVPGPVAEAMDAAEAEAEAEDSYSIAPEAVDTYSDLCDRFGYDAVVAATDKAETPSSLELDLEFFRKVEQILTTEAAPKCPSCEEPTDFVGPTGDGQKCSKCEMGQKMSQDGAEETPTENPPEEETVAPAPQSGDEAPVPEPEPDPEEEREELAHRSSEVETVRRTENDAPGRDVEELDYRAIFTDANRLRREVDRDDEEIAERANDLKELRKEREEKVRELLSVLRRSSERLPLFDRSKTARGETPPKGIKVLPPEVDDADPNPGKTVVYTCEDCFREDAPAVARINEIATRADGGKESIPIDACAECIADRGYIVETDEDGSIASVSTPPADETETVVEPADDTLTPTDEFQPIEGENPIETLDRFGLQFTQTRVRDYAADLVEKYRDRAVMLLVAEDQELPEGRKLAKKHVEGVDLFLSSPPEEKPEEEDLKEDGTDQTEE